MIAYATDALVTAQVALAEEELAGALEVLDEIHATSVVLEALDDGRLVELATMTILRSDLCIVAVTADAFRRVPSAVTPARCVLGPYEAIGLLHGPAGTDPLDLPADRVWLPVTDLVVRYVSGRRVVNVHHDAALLNARLVSLLDEIDQAALDERRAAAAKSAAYGLLPRHARLPLGRREDPPRD